MNIDKWLLRHTFIKQLKEYRRVHMYTGAPVTFDTILALLDITPDELLGVESNKFTPRIEVYTGFTDVTHCHSWLYQLNITLTNKTFLKDDMVRPVLNRELTTMEDFLIDKSGMSYLPVSILTTLRRTIMDCKLSYQKVTREDMREYYDFKFKALLPELNHVIQCFANLALEVDYD